MNICIGKNLSCTFKLSSLYILYISVEKIKQNGTNTKVTEEITHVSLTRQALSFNPGKAFLPPL